MILLSCLIFAFIFMIDVVLNLYFFGTKYSRILFVDINIEFESEISVLFIRPFISFILFKLNFLYLFTDIFK